MMEQKYIDRFHTKYTEKESGCWEWKSGKNKDGYGTFRVGDKCWLSHRYSAYIHGLDMSMPIVRHTCNNPSCVNPEHLKNGTMQDNMDDKVAANRQSKGSNHGPAKINEQQVIEIRNKYKPRIYTLKMLAAEYGLTPEAIRRLIDKKTWKHI